MLRAILQGEKREPNSIVPRTVRENAEFRRDILLAAEESVELQGVLRALCAEDVLFFVNVFVYIIEPRKRRILPFATWPVQDRVFAELKAVAGIEDVDVFKSRDMGATWIIIAFLVWVWLYFENALVLVGSRKDEFVDGKSLKALFPKMEFILQRLPSWMLPDGFDFDKHRTVKALANPENGSQVNGEATIGDFARGDRTFITFIDEAGAIKPQMQAAMLEAAQDNTDCLILNGTIKRKNDTWSTRLRTHPVKQIRMMWWDHPYKGQGLYRTVDGKFRSPAWERALKRANGDERKMAREWDLDPEAAETLGFDLTMLEEKRRMYARPPLRRGWLKYDEDTLEVEGFIDDPNGAVSLWLAPDRNMRMPGDRRYVAASDISMGLATRDKKGPSNSVTVVADSESGEIVAELCTPSHKPAHFARLSVALAHWFAGTNADPLSFRTCLMIWEANGVGNLFRDEVMLYTKNIWYRKVDPRDEDEKRRESDKPGWWNPNEGPDAMLRDMEDAIRAGRILSRSNEFYDECRQYILDERGKLTHSATHKSGDPMLTGHNHGDRVISHGLVVLALDGAGKHVPAASGIARVPVPTYFDRREARRRDDEARKSEAAGKYWGSDAVFTLGNGWYEREG